MFLTLDNIKMNIKTYYQSKFPHIPLWVTSTLAALGTIVILLKLIFKIEEEGIMTNIGTEIYGILITILFVDYFVRKYSKKEWELLNQHIGSRVRGAVQLIEFHCYYILKLKDKDLDSKNMSNFIDLYADKLYDELIQTEDNILNESLKSLNNDLYDILNTAKMNPQSEIVTPLTIITTNISFLVACKNNVLGQLAPEFSKFAKDNGINNFKSLAVEIKKLHEYLEKNIS